MERGSADVGIDSGIGSDIVVMAKGESRAWQRRIGGSPRSSEAVVRRCTRRSREATWMAWRAQDGLSYVAPCRK